MSADVIFIYLSYYYVIVFFFFFSSRRRHTRSLCDWSSDVCSSDLGDGQHTLNTTIGTESDYTRDESGDAAVGACSVESLHRSEERRVGKECRSRWSRNH